MVRPAVFGRCRQVGRSARRAQRLVGAGADVRTSSGRRWRNSKQGRCLSGTEVLAVLTGEWEKHDRRHGAAESESRRRGSRSTFGDLTGQLAGAVAEVLGARRSLQGGPCVVQRMDDEPHQSASTRSTTYTRLRVGAERRKSGSGTNWRLADAQRLMSRYAARLRDQAAAHHRHSERDGGRECREAAKQETAATQVATSKSGHDLQT